MVQMNRMAGKTEKKLFVGDWLLRSEVYTLADGNRCGSERRMDGQRLEGAHNGVRDDAVKVRGEVCEQRSHNPHTGGNLHEETPN